MATPTYNHFDGCFTLEEAITGMNLEQIGTELGLPPERLREGAHVAFAIELPGTKDFELGGWAKYKTSLFTNYKQGKATWDEVKFESVYKGIRFPIPINEAKESWRDLMHTRKLVKVKPVVPHDDKHDYPEGGLVPQIIVMSPILCMNVAFLPPNSGVKFHRIWSHYEQ